jgi:hypothetical protein
MFLITGNKSILFVCLNFNFLWQFLKHLNPEKTVVCELSSFCLSDVHVAK